MACAILGGAECVWQDWNNAQVLGKFDCIVIVKRMALEFEGPVSAYATLHGDTLEAMLEGRAAKGWSNDFPIYSHLYPPSGRNVNIVGDWRGSSGLLAVRVAIEKLAQRRIVLCGIPMDSRPHFDRPKSWGAAHAYQPAWTEHKAEITPFLRSMSGWTMKMFGYPTKEWLNGEVDKVDAA